MPFIRDKKEKLPPDPQVVNDFVKNFKGEKGIDGYTPVKGVDYFDGEKGDKGEKGEKGDRGNQGLKGDRGDIGPAGIGIDGTNGIDGKDGSPDAPEDIVTKLNKQDEAVDITVIKGLKKRLDGLNNQPIPASIRIRAKINGIEQNEPVGSINFPTGSTHTGQDYTVSSGSSGVTWGGITGTLSNQTDLQNALNLKAVIASPTFTGTVTTPNLTLSTFTAGSVLFAGTGGAVAQDNANFFWDDTNNVLMVNTNTGSSSTSGALVVKSSSDAATNGTEIILATADRDFSSDTGNWTGTNWVIGGGLITHTAGANTLTLNSVAITAPIIGGNYRLSVAINTTSTVASTLIFSFGGISYTLSSSSTTYGVTATESILFRSISSTATLTITPDTTWTGTFDNFTILPITKSVPNNIRLRSTGAISHEERFFDASSVSLGVGGGSNTTAPLRRLVSLGSGAMRSNTTGQFNIAIGETALAANTTGSSNTAIGRSALNVSTSASNNTALGASALSLLSTGGRNVALGASTLSALTTGSNNLGLGSSALTNMLIGGDNISIGALSGNALQTNTTAQSENVFIGYGSASSTIGGTISSANKNTVIGTRSLNVTGGPIAGISTNIAIGYNCATGLSTGYTNNIVIGNQINSPTNTGSNQLTIGNIIFGTGITGTGTTIAGKASIGVAVGTARFEVKGSGSTSATQTFAAHNSTGTNNAHIILDDGNNGFGVGTPTATGHFKAGTATANTAPLKFNTGTALTTPEDGAVEYHSSHLYFTIGSTRYQLDQQSGGSGTVTSVTSADANITVATTTTTPVITLVQTPALKSATTTIDVASATAPTTGQVLTATGASAATWQTPSSSSATMASFKVINQNYTTNPYTLWGTSPVISVGTPPTMDANGSLSLPVSTTWKVTLLLDASLGALNDYLGLNPVLTNTTTGITNSMTGGAVLLPNSALGDGGATGSFVTPNTAGGNPLPATFVAYVKVGTIAKFLRFEGQSFTVSNGSNFQSLTIEKIA